MAWWNDDPCRARGTVKSENTLIGGKIMRSKKRVITVGVAAWSSRSCREYTNHLYGRAVVGGWASLNGSLSSISTHPPEDKKKWKKGLLYKLKVRPTAMSPPKMTQNILIHLHYKRTWYRSSFRQRVSPTHTLRYTINIYLLPWSLPCSSNTSIPMFNSRQNPDTSTSINSITKLRSTLEYSRRPDRHSCTSYEYDYHGI